MQDISDLLRFIRDCSPDEATLVEIVKRTPLLARQWHTIGVGLAAGSMEYRSDNDPAVLRQTLHVAISLVEVSRPLLAQASQRWRSRMLRARWLETAGQIVALTGGTVTIPAAALNAWWDVWPAAAAVLGSLCSLLARHFATTTSKSEGASLLPEVERLLIVGSEVLGEARIMSDTLRVVQSAQASALLDRARAYSEDSKRALASLA